MITAFLILYAVIVLLLVLSIARSASQSMPPRSREDELLRLMLRTELRSKPDIWLMDEAA